MKYLKSRVVVLLVSAVFFTALIAAAGYHTSPKYAKYHVEFVVKVISEELKLNEGQVKSLKKVAAELLSIKKEMHENRAKSHKEIIDLLAQSKLNREKLAGMANAKINLIQSRIPRLTQVLGEFYDGLSTEQRDKLRDHAKNRIARYEILNRQK